MFVIPMFFLPFFPLVYILKMHLGNCGIYSSLYFVSFFPKAFLILLHSHHGLYFKWLCKIPLSELPNLSVQVICSGRIFFCLSQSASENFTVVGQRKPSSWKLSPMESSHWNQLDYSSCLRTSESWLGVGIMTFHSFLSTPQELWWQENNWWVSSSKQLIKCQFLPSC